MAWTKRDDQPLPVNALRSGRTVCMHDTERKCFFRILSRWKQSH